MNHCIPLNWKINLIAVSHSFAAFFSYILFFWSVIFQLVIVADDVSMSHCVCYIVQKIQWLCVCKCNENEWRLAKKESKMEKVRTQFDINSKYRPNISFFSLHIRTWLLLLLLRLQSPTHMHLFNFLFAFLFNLAFVVKTHKTLYLSVDHILNSIPMFHCMHLFPFLLKYINFSIFVRCTSFWGHDKGVFINKSNAKICNNTKKKWRVNFNIIWREREKGEWVVQKYTEEMMAMRKRINVELMHPIYVYA